MYFKEPFFVSVKKMPSKNKNKKQGLDLLGVLPADQTVYEFDLAGKPTVQLPEDAPVRKALAGLLGQLGL